MEKPTVKNNTNPFARLIKNRFIVFIVFLAISFISHFLFTKSFFPQANTQDLWFYSGIVMVLFSILFIEPYYTSPKNVIANTIPLLLVFISIREVFTNQLFWWVATIFLLSLLIFSIVAMSIEDKNKSPNCKQNKFSEWLKRAVVIFGRGKVLYSWMFFYFLLSYQTINNPYVLILFAYWFAIILIDPKSLHNDFSIKHRASDESQIGEIFGVQSNKIVLAKLFQNKSNVHKFDIVKFKNSMSDVSDSINLGIVFDTYLLNQEKWAKVLSLKKIEEKSVSKENLLYMVSDKSELKSLNKQMKINSFVGIVIEGSNIGKIRFEYSKKTDDLQEGDLLELKIGARRLFYQVISGTTYMEVLEAKNETGLIQGEAIQLGEWLNSSLSFQKYGWVPSINTPLFLADTSDIQVEEYSYPEYKLGVIPGTTLPSVINLRVA